MSSFDNLHRYFDYTLQNRDKQHYQYALLHMAILHADFGCFSEAIAAINETISTARENQDMICLNYSLSWLYHLSKAYPTRMKGAGYGGMLGSEKEGLVFLKTKAREARLWNQMSSVLLSEAYLTLSRVNPFLISATLVLSDCSFCSGRERPPGLRIRPTSVSFERRAYSCWECCSRDAHPLCVVLQARYLRTSREPSS